MPDRSDILVQSLQEEALFPHPVERFQVMETHISYVLLTGEYAYKWFKPVELGFLDFTTLESRRDNCHRELELNRRLAPNLYLEVIDVTGTPEHPVLEGDGEPFEHLVKMKEFDQKDRLDRMLEDGRLLPDLMDEAADRIARFHEEAPADPPDPGFGSPSLIKEQLAGTVESLMDQPLESHLISTLNQLREQMESTFASLKERMAERHQAGWVREVHGDLHLENIVQFEGRICVFDCVEFDPSLRWIDLMNDVAFLKMDFDFREREGVGWRFLNRYLERTGDYRGVELLDFYETHRALIRALVTTLKKRDKKPSNVETGKQNHQKWTAVEKYLTLCKKIQERPGPVLVFTHGVSGTGKTTLTRLLLEEMGGLRIRTDVERKRLYGLRPADKSGDNRTEEQEFGEGIYTEEATRKTYRRLRDCGRVVLRSGHNLFLDGTYLRREFREEVLSLARELSVPVVLLNLEAPASVLKERIQERQESAEETVSEATISILENQLEQREPLSEQEKKLAIDVDASQSFQVESLLNRISSVAKNQ